MKERLFLASVPHLAGLYQLVLLAVGHVVATSTERTHRVGMCVLKHGTNGWMDHAKPTTSLNFVFSNTTLFHLAIVFITS